MKPINLTETRARLQRLVTEQLQLEAQIAIGELQQRIDGADCTELSHITDYLDDLAHRPMPPAWWADISTPEALAAFVQQLDQDYIAAIFDYHAHRPIDDLAGELRRAGLELAALLFVIQNQPGLGRRLRAELTFDQDTRLSFAVLVDEMDGSLSEADQTYLLAQTWGEALPVPAHVKSVNRLYVELLGAFAAIAGSEVQS